MSDSLLDKLKEFFGFGRNERTSASRHADKEQAPRRPGRHTECISRLLKQNGQYKAFIGVPFDKPRKWAAADIVHQELLIDGQLVDLDQIKSFVITYPSGQVVDLEPGSLVLPEGVSWLEQKSGPPDSDSLNEEDLQEGRKFVQISYAKSKDSHTHYQTTLSNISQRRLRVVKFAGYSRGRGKDSTTYKLNTVTGKFYSAQEFREWYGQQTEWLEPGQSATDPNNYGAVPGLWAYYCETDDGLQFIAGAILTQLP